MAPDIRPTASMSRVDQLMVDHGVNCSIQMLQHIAPCEFIPNSYF